MVFGQVGTGKTTLARDLAQRMDDDEEISYIFLTNASFPTSNQLLRAIMQEFQVPQTHRSYLELLNIFKSFLRDQSLNHAKTLVLIIDEAQTLTSTLLEMVRQLMNYESNDQKFLQIVLFAEESFRARLQHPRYRNLVTRTAMSSTVENLSLTDTAAMLKHRWLIAGGKDFPFTDDALERIFTYSQGVPRTQVILGDNCLLAAFIAGVTKIDAGLVEGVIKERGLPDAPPQAAPNMKKHVRGTTASVRRGA
jgi:general secretion pathway protein A